MGFARTIAARLPPSPRLRNRVRQASEGELDRIELGALGEDLACRELTREGLKVLYRNFRGPHGGEIDVLCRDGDILVFVEVKTRRGEGFGRPAAAVDAEKERLLAKGAQAWLRMLSIETPVLRFDIVELIIPPHGPWRYHRIEDAFQLPRSHYP